MENDGDHRYDKAVYCLWFLFFLWAFQLSIGLIFVLLLTRKFLLTSKVFSQNSCYHTELKINSKILEKRNHNFLTARKMVLEKQIVFSIEEKSYDELQAFNGTRCCIIFIYCRTSCSGDHAPLTHNFDHFSLNPGPLPRLVALLH